MATAFSLDNMHRPNTYLTMLKSNVDRIVKSMGIRKPENVLVYKLDGKIGTFDYEEVMQAREDGEVSIYSKVWRRRIPISDILNQSAPDGTAEELRLLDDIVQSCQNIQAGYEYASTSDGTSREDIRNRRIQNDLNRKYRIFDQPQRGFGGTGQSSGELDL